MGASNVADDGDDDYGYDDEDDDDDGVGALMRATLPFTTVPLG